jgi:hypothetical protein
LFTPLTIIYFMTVVFLLFIMFKVYV